MEWNTMYMQCMPVRYAFEVLGWVLAGETVDMYLTLFNLAYNLVYVNIRIGLVSFILYLRS